MNLAMMLNWNKAPVIKVAAPTADPNKRGRGAPRGEANKRRQDAIKRYRDVMQGKQLTGREISAALGLSDMSNAWKTLKRLEGDGYVKRLSARPNGTNHPPIEWAWVAD